MQSHNKKNIRNRIWLGLKEGWEVEILPKYIIDFEKLFVVKLAKFVGSISMTLIITGFAHNFNFLFFLI